MLKLPINQIIRGISHMKWNIIVNWTKVNFITQSNSIYPKLYSSNSIQLPRLLSDESLPIKLSNVNFLLFELKITSKKLSTNLNKYNSNSTDK